VVRRSTYIAGAISHCVLGGMGVARYLQVVHGLEWLTPLVGATAAALIAGVIIGVVTMYGRQRVDTVLSAVWALGMAIGISFITLTPGYSQDLMSYLFGSILMVTPRDLWLMVMLNTIIVAVTILFFNKFLAICFHEELARLRGIRTGAYTMLLMVMTALTVVLLVQIVGIVLVIALLTLPAATAAHLTKRLLSMMVLATILTLLFTLGGLAISYQPQLPVSATIIELSGGVYLLVVGGGFVWKKLRFR
jgi:zinc transport system permease protein